MCLLHLLAISLAERDKLLMEWQGIFHEVKDLGLATLSAREMLVGIIVDVIGEVKLLAFVL